MITAGVGAPPAISQSAITVVSPHAGERVTNWPSYWVRWSAGDIPGNAGFRVSYIAGGGDRATICTAPPSGRACQWGEPDWFATQLRIEALDSSGATIASVDSGLFEFVPNTIPAAWTHYDIGAPGRSGTAWGDGAGEISVRGSGADIWGTADAFHFAYAETLLDMNATATIAGIDGAHAWTKAGLMLRENLLAGSPHHFLLASKGKGLAYQRRRVQNGTTEHTTISASSDLPVTFEVMRRADYIVVDMRRGSGAWERVTEFISGASNLLVGLAVTSHDNSAFADGHFQNVDVRNMTEEKVSILSPQVGDVVEAGVPYTIRWTHTQPTNVATVSFSTDGGQTWSVVPGCQSIDATSCLWNNPGPLTERARVRVVVENPADRQAWNVTYYFAIRGTSGTPLPDGWVARDIGNVGAAGASAYDAATGRFIVDGSGGDIWGTADALHYAARTMSRGPMDVFELTARVMSVENVNQWTKAGIMVRAHTGANAAHASFFVTPTTVKGTAFQRRRYDGATSLHTSGPAISAPIWLKLVFAGDVRAYYRTSTFEPWRFLGEESIDVGSTFEMGLAVSSHVAGTRARATFDEVSIRRIPAWIDEDIGAATEGNAMSDLVNTYVTSAGADIWGTADAFRFRYTEAGSQVTVGARVLSLTNTDPWAKAGVMIRDGEVPAPGSKHVMLILSPGKGIAMQYRAATDGASANVSIVPGRFPTSLRLIRDGSLFIGQASRDGVSWQEIGRINVAMGSVVTAGLAVTSHNTSTAATAHVNDLYVQPGR
jgi:hypothetical protein